MHYAIVEAHSGTMGGSQSHEFMVRSEAGEDLAVSCSCRYAANMERAESLLEAIQDPINESAKPQKVHTPGQKTIAEVSSYLKISPTRQIKSLVYLADSRPVLILLRGDHSLNEAKFSSYIRSAVFRPANNEEIATALGADAGSLGPCGVVTMRILADNALRHRNNMVCGANENDYHLMGVTPEIHFQAEFADFRIVQEGDLCPQCRRQKLQVYKALEIGHIFKLGTKYSESMGATVLTHDGREVPIVMGSYGIGVERILASAIELYHDADGIIWPVSIAPFQVVVTPVEFSKEDQRQTAEAIYRDLTQAGLEVLLDDRSERPGVKFKDADLIGIPFRITVGPKLLKENKVELYTRTIRRMEPVEIKDILSRLRKALQDAMPQVQN